MRSQLTFVLCSLAVFLLAPSWVRAQTTSGDGSPAKVEPGSGELLKKVTDEVGDLKKRLHAVEEQMANDAKATKLQHDKFTQSLSSLQTKVDKLHDDLMTEQEKFRALGDVTKMLEKFRDNVKAWQDGRDGTDGQQRRHDSIQSEMAQMQSDILKLQLDVGRLRSQMDSLRTPSDVGREDSQRRSSLSLPLPLPPDSTATPTNPARPLLGTVRLVNSYVYPVSIVVDGKPYALGTNEAMNLERLPGAFTYEVVGIQGNTLRTVNAGETLTIRVYPR
jgi:hypothetical protein